jgi:hypothetical protein
VKQQTSSTEFVGWMVYLQENEFINGHHRIDYYLAQIAMWAKKAIVKKPESVTMEDMMLQFSKVSEMMNTPQEQKKKQAVEDRTAHSKNFWFSALGMKTKG